MASEPTAGSAPYAESVIEFRWASETGRSGMPHPDELEYFGFVRVRRHPFYPASWLMRRDA